MVAAFLCVLGMTSLYRASPRTSMGLFIDLNNEVSSLSRRSLDQKHLLAECRPTMQGMRAVGYDPTSLLMPAPKMVMTAERGSTSGSLVMLSEVFTIFSRVYEEEDDDKDKEDIVAARETVHDMLHRFCSQSTRPISISEEYNHVSSGMVTSLDVEISRKHRRHDFNATTSEDDESYTITMEKSSPRNISLSVRAGSVNGAVYAINSALTQLFSGEEALLKVGGGGLPLTIQDWPEYRWRGVMVDVARHYIPVSLLKRTIEGMAFSRLNTLHLHLSDAEAFRVILVDTPQFPELSKLGKVGGPGYTIKDLKEVVAFAARFGIKVVPEIDVPAHVASWGLVYPDLVIKCQKAAEVFGRTPKNVYTLDISKIKAVMLVGEMISQLMEVFSASSDFFHLGGDELHMDCWDESESMLSALKERYNSTGIAAKTAVYRDFEHTLMSLVHDKHGKTPIVWSGVQDSGAIPAPSSFRLDGGNRTSSKNAPVPPVVVEAWKCWSALAVRAGLRAAEYDRQVLMSACWYLDFNHDWLEYLSTNMAAVLPVQAVVGGEGAIWTENADHTNFECRVWPRLGAIASRLWGFDAEGRLFDQSNNNTLGVRTKSVDLSVAATKSLYLSYIHFRSLLHKNLGIRAADMVFHVSDPVQEKEKEKWKERNAMRGLGDIFGGSERIVPRRFASAREEKQFLFEYLSVGGTLATASKLQPRIKRGAIRLTSQCLSISEKVQTRPITMKRVLLSQVNVAGGEKDKLLAEFLRDKASRGAMLVGMCELNGWQRMRSSSSYDISGNRPQMDFLAAESGFAYSYVASKKEQPYNLGAVSALPFTIVAEYGPKEGFERGLLHILLDSLDTHVIIAHLHAHDSVQRESEARMVADIIGKIRHLEEQAKIVVMGDLNTLSRWDASEHRRQDLVARLKRTDASVWKRMATKFLDGLAAEINYKPMEILLDTGLHDSCVVSCLRDEYSIAAYRNAAWTANGTDAFSKCMSQHCLASEPTQFEVPDWEWPKSVGEKHPAVRLDFILVSTSLALGGRKLSAGFDVDQTTTNMSDHFPMSASWDADREYPLYRRHV